MSITPAFSPIPASSLPIGVSGASSLNRRRCTLDDLYEQCSDHMTEYMASSDEVGRRPRISMILAYSSRFKPSAAHGWASPGLERAFATVSATRARLPADRRLRSDRPTPAHRVVRAEPGDRQGGVGGHGEPHTATTIVDEGAEDSSPEQRDQHRLDRAELLPDQGHRIPEDEDPAPDADDQRTYPQRSRQAVVRRDRLAAHHVQRVPVDDPLDEIAQVAAAVRTAGPVQH